MGDLHVECDKTMARLWALAAETRQQLDAAAALAVPPIHAPERAFDKPSDTEGFARLLLTLPDAERLDDCIADEGEREPDCRELAEGLASVAREGR